MNVVWATVGAPQADPLPHYITVAELLFEKHDSSFRSRQPLEPSIKGFEKGVVCDKNCGNLQGLAAEVAKLLRYADGNKVVVVMANTRRTIKGYKDDASLAGQTVSEPGRAAAFATTAPRISTS